jgi:D-xylose transport system substrate-binding protein
VKRRLMRGQRLRDVASDAAQERDADPGDPGGVRPSRRDFIVGGAAAMMATGLAACGSDSSGGGSGSSGGGGGGGGGASVKGKKVGFSVPDYDQLRWKNGDQRFFVQEAKRLGMEPIVAVADDSVDTQASQVRNMLTQGIDALVLTPVDQVASAGAVRPAIAAKIPVISYNFLVQGVDVVAFVGRDDESVGVDLAKAAVAAKPQGNYVLCFGDQGTSVARDKAKGNLKVLDPLVKSGDIKIVAQQFIKGWSPSLARQVVTQALTAHNNDIAAVVCSNDGCAYGAIQALQGAGLAGKTYVTGEDAEWAALAKVKQGTLGVTSFTPFNELGIKAAQAIGTVLGGGKIDTGHFKSNPNKVPWIQVAAVNVDKHNLDAFAQKYPWWTNKTFTGL